MLIEVTGPKKQHMIFVDDTIDEAVARRAAYCHVYSEESLGELTASQQVDVIAEYTEVHAVTRISTIHA